MLFNFKHANLVLIEASIFLIIFAMSSLSFAQYSPWIKKANMPTGRHSQAASVVDGKIYVAGGRYTLHSLNEYNPATDTWATKASMPTGRMALSGCEVNGKIYAIGGLAVAFTRALSTVQEYDPVSDSWTTKTSMPTPRLGLGTSVVNGKIYAIGGMTSGSNFWSGMHNCVEVYDPETDSWSTVSSMPTDRCWFSTSVVEGKIFAIGGILVTKEVLATVEVYDPASDTWTTKTPMPTARAAHAAAVVDGIIYVIGGGSFANPGNFSVVEAYNPTTDTWMKNDDIPEERSLLSASMVEGKIYAIGGIPDFVDPHLHGEKTVYVYDPLKNLTGLGDQLNLLNENTPRQFSLNQNYPNPFNPKTVISYSLGAIHESPVHVDLSIYSVFGQKVSTLISKKQLAGNYQIEWNASGFSSGIYFYKLHTGNKTITKKMILLK